MTTLHVLRKDLRHHARWLAAWALVCASPLAVLAVPDDALTMRIAINTLGPALRIVLFLVLVAMVVHDDPLVDSTAFWLTRPIGSKALLCSKLLFVGLALVVPAAIADVVLVAASGLVRDQVLLAVPEVLLEWTLWAAGVLVLAALTSTLTGMLVACLQVGVLWLQSTRTRSHRRCSPCRSPSTSGMRTSPDSSTPPWS